MGPSSTMEAYSEFLVAIDAWEIAATTDWARVMRRKPADAHVHRKVIVDAERRFAAAASREYPIGPDMVRKVAAEYNELVLDRSIYFEQFSDGNSLAVLEFKDDVALACDRSVLLASMNRATGIGPPRRFRGRFLRVE